MTRAELLAHLASPAHIEACARDLVTVDRDGAAYLTCFDAQQAEILTCYDRIHAMRARAAAWFGRARGPLGEAS